MKLKLKLHPVPVAHEPEPGASLRFPVRAVRAMPSPSRTNARSNGQEGHVSEQDRHVLRHPELIRQIEATLDRMQAGVDQLNEQVNNYKFPGMLDEERPRAA